MRISDQEANRLRLLKAIRRAEPVSRTELVALTGLAVGTVSALTAELLRRNFLIEERDSARSGGRPRMQLRLNAKAAHVVGVFVFPDGTLEVGIADLRGDRIFAETYPIARAPTLEAYADQIAERIADTITASPLDRQAIDSVGVGLPATIDSIGGVVHWMITYPPEPVAFAAIISGRLGLPVFLDNAANVVARAEHWFGEDRQVEDFCMVVLGLGLSFAQYVDGLLWAGPRGLNAEFSHLKVFGAEGPACACGANGCLLTYATMHGIAQQIAAGRGEKPPAFRTLDAVFETLAEEARSGEPMARAVFDRAGEALGLAMANHVNIWDSPRIVLLCRNATLVERIDAPFKAALERNTLPALRGRAVVDFIVSDEHRFSRGAAALVLEQLFRVPEQA